MTRGRQPVLDDLHDATLESVVIRWETGDAVVSLATGIRGWDRLRLVTTGIVLLTCTREQPWGYSVSVNSATRSSIETSTGTKQRICIEIQSGDRLVIVADDVRFEK